MTRLPLARVVLDSSVVIKWFREGEASRDKALELRQAYLDGHLSILFPDLLIYEIANVLRYKPDLSREQVRLAVQSLFDMGIDIVGITTQVIGQSIELAYDYEVTVYDASFIALAMESDAHFVTADERLFRKVSMLEHVHFLGDVHLPSLEST